jgi:hypothetical protein
MAGLEEVIMLKRELQGKNQCSIVPLVVLDRLIFLLFPFIIVKSNVECARKQHHEIRRALALCSL